MTVHGMPALLEWARNLIFDESAAQQAQQLRKDGSIVSSRIEPGVNHLSERSPSTLLYKLGWGAAPPAYPRKAVLQMQDAPSC